MMVNIIEFVKPRDLEKEKQKKWPVTYFLN